MHQPLESKAADNLHSLLSTPAHEFTLEQALEEVGVSPTGGVGRFQQRMVCVCGAGWLADNAWLNTVILIEAQVQPEFALSNSETTFLLTILFIGEIVGSSFWGPISDKFGRKPAFLGSLTIAGTVGVGVACAPSYAVLLVLLFIVGTGVGGNLPVDGAMFAELVPGSQRGRLLTVLSAFWSLGNFMSSLLAWALIPGRSCGTDSDFSGCSMWDNAGWRFVVGGLAVLNLASLLTRIGMPESPAFLMNAGRVDEANAVMKAMAEANGTSWPEGATLVANEEPPDAEVGCPPDENAGGSTVRKLLRDLKKLHSMDKMSLTVLLLACVWFFSNLGYGMYNPIVPRLMKRKGISSNGHVYRDLLIYSAAGIPGSIMAAWLVDTKLGRTKTIALSALGMAAALTAFNLVKDELSVIVVNSCINFASQPMYAAIYLYTPEVIPAVVRGTIVAWLAALSRTSATIAPSLADIFLDNDLESALWVVCLTSIGLTSLCALMLPIETRDRKLE